MKTRYLFIVLLTLASTAYAQLPATLQMPERQLLAQNDTNIPSDYIKRSPDDVRSDYSSSDQNQRVHVLYTTTNVHTQRRSVRSTSGFGEPYKILKKNVDDHIQYRIGDESKLPNHVFVDKKGNPLSMFMDKKGNTLSEMDGYSTNRDAVQKRKQQLLKEDRDAREKKPANPR